jgi:TonB family protein
MPRLRVLLALVLAAPVVAVAAQECPPARVVAPELPAAAADRDLHGVSVVGARFDDCGRVVETRLERSSGHPLLDEAARATVGSWVLPGEVRAKAVGEWIRQPVRFGRAEVEQPQPIDWPRSHRRPRYVEDAVPFPYASAEDAFVALTQSDAVLLKPAYRPVVHSFFRTRDAAPREYWLVLHGPRVLPNGRLERLAAVRYRLESDGETPVLRIALRCERGPEECARIRSFVFDKGLRFARPRRS